jgi:hypothetical protein
MTQRFEARQHKRSTETEEMQAQTSYTSYMSETIPTFVYRDYLFYIFLPGIIPLHFPVVPSNHQAPTLANTLTRLFNSPVEIRNRIGSVLR